MEYTKRIIKRGKIKITLLSDLCTSDGSGYNSMINTDVCYDSYGFPYIPGKRIKGCLRECAVELLNWTLLEKEEVEKLFGTDVFLGKSQEMIYESGVRIGNAYLDGYDSMKAEIVPKHVLFHAQNIMSKFTYVREQTTINYWSGVAEGNGKLRSNRVVAKGLVFYTEIEFAAELEEPLQKCCQIFTHLGMYRTRGYGEIKAELEVLGEEEIELPEQKWPKQLTEKSATIYYTMSLQEPVVCKSVAGDATVTMDYIEGGKILGSILRKMKQDGVNIEDILDGEEFICSNAYIGEDGERFTEVPACYYSIKNNSDNFINRIYPKDETKSEKETNSKNKKSEDGLQFNKMKHCYVLEESSKEGVGLRQKHVEIETSYHHRRPENKAIGHPIRSNENTFFFHVEGISPEQEFYGFISGSAKQLQAISKYIEGIHYIGYSKHAEFGKTSIKIDKVVAEDEECIFEEANEILVKLEAPTILYNDRAFYSIDVSDLQRKIETELGIESSNIKKDDAGNDMVKAYLNYVRLGGYNVTWNCRKPTIDAFDKGTVLHYILKKPIQIPKTHFFLGERVQEGYGEASVCVVHTTEKEWEGNRKGSFIKKATQNEEGNYLVSKGSFAEKMCVSLFEEFYKSRVIEDAKTFRFLKENKEMFKFQKDRCALVFQILLKLCKESRDRKHFEEMKEKLFVVKGKDFEKKKRKEISERILEGAKKNIDDLKTEFCTLYHLKWNPSETESAEYYLGYLEKFVFELRRTPLEGENRNGQTQR